MREPRSQKKPYRRPNERDVRSRSPQARREPPKDLTSMSGDKPRQPTSITSGRPQPWGTARPARRAADSSRNSGFNLRNLLFGDVPRSPRAEGLQKVSPTDNRPAQAPRSPSSPTLYTVSQPVTRLDAVRPVNPFQADPQQRRTQAAPTSAQPKPRRERRSVSPLLHLVRLLIFGLGIGAIAGTTMALVNPSTRLSGASLQATAQGTENATSGGIGVNGSLGALSSFVRLSQELKPLTTTVQELSAQVPDITPGVYMVDLDTGAYLNFNGAMAFPAASTIKVPILVAFLQDVDAGKIHLDELLTMEQEDVTDEAGVMQYQPVGTQYTALETAEMMISISDNTATNILIRRMGGMLALNQRFQSWGLTNTVIRSPLADLGGTNTTTPKELTELLVKVSQGELLSLRSRDRLMEIMQSTVTDTLIPTGIGDEKAIVAHKTGTINGMVGDTGIVDMPSGKRFVVTVLAQRPEADDRAQELIRQICGAIYSYLKQPPPQSLQMPTTSPTDASPSQSPG